MAKTKSELLSEATDLGLEVTTKNTIAEIKEAITAAESKPAESDEPALAKAGKRSAKAVREADEEREKEERKASDTQSDEPVKKTKPVKPTRTRLERRSKNYKQAAKLIDKTKDYSIKDAIKLAKETSTTKFDATVELHVRLDVDPKQADQNIRGTVVLPAGTGQTLRVAVFAEGDDVKKAKDAGADIALGDELLQQLEKEQIDFDVLISTPKNMAKLGKFARVLGPKGLMPNPKSGTVTTDVAKAVTEAKAGKVEYRVDSAGIVHSVVGKVSFKEEDLVENMRAVLTAIKNAKPANVKSTYVQSVYATTSMGPSVKIAISEV